MSDLTSRRKAYPELTGIIDLISAQNPLQRKRISTFVSQQDETYWIFGEDLIQTLNRSFLKSEQERIDAARSYNRMCMDLLREEIRFHKTGVYLLDNARAAQEAVYDQRGVMRYYIIGLLLSYLFWPNHYEIFRFFKDHLQSINVARYLEVGIGHGLFTAEVLRRFPNIDMTVVDVSETSIEIGREMLETFQLDASRARFVHSDFLTVSLETDGFDFILMGEVLEHVNDAPGFLKKAYNMLRPAGQIFLTTCVNCPAPDHVYQFHTVGEIRTLIRDVGLTIVEEIVLPVLPVPEDRWQEELVTINYGAYLQAG
jgi:2-polyprenyl-3-methyl-5-hydroxy-6-metoxy-1,4-benzoquinol methylase